MPPVEEEDKDKGKATFWYKNFWQEKERVGDKPIVSDAFIVEGRKFRLHMYPNGHNDGANTHLAVYVECESIEKDLDLDLPRSTKYRVELVHKSDETRNVGFSCNKEFDLTGDMMSGTVKLHELARLQEDGFIYDNGSLALRLIIEKNNL